MLCLANPKTITISDNYEAQFYGVFGSNHAEQSASYFAPVVAYQPVAAKLARLIAGRLRLKGVACNASLHFPAGGAPWGFQVLGFQMALKSGFGRLSPKWYFAITLLLAT